MSQPEPGDVIKDITADVSTIIKGEIDLAKAELVPQAKGLGIGAGLLAGAGVFAVIALNALFFAIAFAYSAIFWVALGWAPPFAIALGFVCAMLTYLLIAAPLALIGLKKIKFQQPKATIENGKKAVNSITHALSAGLANASVIAAKGAKSFATDGRGKVITLYKGQTSPKDLESYEPDAERFVVPPASNFSRTTGVEPPRHGATAVGGRDAD